MKSCRDVKNNNTYDKIYQKAADVVSPQEISLPRIVKYQTMRSNVPSESPENYYLRYFYYPFLDSVILLLWQKFFRNHSDVVVCKRAYKLCKPGIFPAVKILLSILATLPVSSVTAKPSFSILRLIKSDLRTPMGQARLDDLCLMYINNDI